MADRMCAEIWLGGKCPRSALEEKPFDGLWLDWDNSPIDTSSAASILAARDQDGHLHFADTEASWGEFEQLEAWAKRHNVPFERRNESKYEFDAQRIWFRPDLPKKQREGWIYTTQEGTPLIVIEPIAKVVAKMRRLDEGTQQSAVQRLAAWRRLLRKLTLALPPDMPPLPPFEIEGEASR
jgi:hypothetical protein